MKFVVLVTNFTSTKRTTGTTLMCDMRVNVSTTNLGVFG